MMMMRLKNDINRGGRECVTRGAIYGLAELAARALSSSPTRVSRDSRARARQEPECLSRALQEANAVHAWISFIAPPACGGWYRDLIMRRLCILCIGFEREVLQSVLHLTGVDRRIDWTCKSLTAFGGLVVDAEGFARECRNSCRYVIERSQMPRTLIVKKMLGEKIH